MKRAATSLPPAIVLSVNSPIGLTVVREIGSRGVPVHACAHSPSAIGLRSRYAAQCHVLAPDDDAVAVAINRIADRKCFAIPIGEADGLRLGRIAERGLAPNVRALCAPLAAQEIANDKKRSYAIAKSVGIEIPKTWHPRPGDAPPDWLSYPCIAKLSDPLEAEAALRKAGIDIDKCVYFFDRDSLVGYLDRYAETGVMPMVQSYARGYGLGQMMLMRDGEAVLRFQHRRLAEWPPTGGVSTMCRALPADLHGALFDRSEALLQRMGWEGPAMVEYRHDPESGASTLMEVNGRFWGSLPLASWAGAEFGWSTYAGLGLRQELSAAGYNPGAHVVYMVPQMKRLGSIALERGPSLRRRLGGKSRWQTLLSDLRALLKTRGRGYVFRLSDPLPWTFDLGQMLRTAFRRRQPRWSEKG